MKKVLLLLSTYNGCPFLKEQLDSIKNQIDVDVTLLVRDDGSKDCTVNFIEEYIQCNSEFKVNIIKGDNVGSTISFSLLLQEASRLCQLGDIYDFYAFADQDDIWHKNKLKAAIDLIENTNYNHNEPITYCSNTLLYFGDTADSKLAYPLNSVNVSQDRAIIHNLGTGCTMVFNYKAIEYYNMHNVSDIFMHDHLLYLVCIYLGSVIYDDNSYIFYRQHAGNQIGLKRSFAQRWKRRIKNLRGNKHLYEEISTNFLNTYRDFLSIEDSDSLILVSNYRKNIKKRLKLLFSKTFRYNSMERNIMFYLKVIMGRL